MAVTQVIEHKRNSVQRLEQQDEYLVPTSVYTRFFQVVVDSPSTAHADIYSHASIPKLFETHPEYDGVICKSVTPEQGDDDNSYVYEVTAEYDDQYNGADPEEPEDGNPLNRPVIIQGGFSEYEQILFRDINGVPIRNSAKDRFDPPVTRKAGALRFTMIKNYPTLNLTLIRNYKNAINSDTWNGFTAGVVRIANIGFSRQVEAWKVDDDTTLKVVFWTLTFDFEIAEEQFGGDGTWKLYVLDQGMMYYPGGTRKAIKAQGIPVSSPVNLNGSGGLGSQDSPYWLSFDVYRPLPFAALGLL